MYGEKAVSGVSLLTCHTLTRTNDNHGSSLVLSLRRMHDGKWSRARCICMRDSLAILQPCAFVYDSPLLCVCVCAPFFLIIRPAAALLLAFHPPAF
jgi:hypothetical protein